MAMRLDQKMRLLSALPLFQAMEPEAVHVLAFSVRERALPAGEILFRKGEASDGGYLVVAGAIDLDPASGALDRRRCGPGTLIGEVALVSATERPATAVAAEETRLLAIPRALMLQVLEAHPDSAARLRAHVAGRLGETRDGLRSLVG